MALSIDTDDIGKGVFRIQVRSESDSIAIEVSEGASDEEIKSVLREVVAKHGTKASMKDRIKALFDEVVAE